MGDYMNDNIYSKISEYMTFSQDALFDEMKKLAKEGKEDGSLNNETIENFYRQASSFLGENELKKLKEILDAIKS